MKQLIRTFLLLIGLGFATSLTAQQFPFSNYQIIRNGPFNPAHIPSSGLGELKAGHQQWGVNNLSWNSSSQFFQVQSRSRGKREVFSWGALILNGQIHTENRLSIMPFISAKVVDQNGLKLSVGIAAGLLNQYSNYSNRDIYHREDELLFGNQFNYLDLDAGMGAELSWSRPGLRAELGANAGQLTGNTLTKDLDAMRVVPSVNLDGSFLFRPTFNVMVGPRLFSRLLMARSETNDTLLAVNSGNLYAGLTLELERQELWFSGLYRIDGGSLVAGFGMPIMRSDTSRDKYAFRSFLDLYFSLSYPVKTADAFGPTAEIGLDWKFGKKNRALEDTLHWANTFWKTETHMTEHKERYLDPNGPNGLICQSVVRAKTVYMTYEFPDLSKQYSGDQPFMKDGLVQRIGYEWIGVDGLLENIPGEVIKEAIRPDSSYVRDPENIEPLRHVSWVELSCHLRADEFGAGFTSEVVYAGEYGTNDTTGTLLLIPVVFDGRDTILQIEKGYYMSNLQLAALKLYAMGSKLEFEMNRRMSHRFNIIREDAPVDPELEDLADEEYGFLPKIKLKKYRITSNNPNLQAFQVNRVEMKFVRFKRYWERQNDGWIDNPDPEEKYREEERRLNGEPEEDDDEW